VAAGATWQPVCPHSATLAMAANMTKPRILDAVIGLQPSAGEDSDNMPLSPRRPMRPNDAPDMLSS
jgi:hypothetical protein